jgi:hypothetical protein
MAQLVTHIPNKSELMVRYYGCYSNKSRGMRNFYLYNSHDSKKNIQY